jgi:hypothetical protein
MSKRDLIIKASSPYLEPGETVEIAAMAAVGQVSVGRQVATAAAVAVLSAGMFTATVRPARRALVLTNRRLLFFPSSQPFDRPQSKLLAALPREVLQARKRRSLINATYDLVDAAGSGKAIRLTFALPSRALGAQLAAALNAPAPA